MKYSLLVLALLFSNLLSAQKQSTAINSKAFKIQGGYLVDRDPGKNYFGFNMFNLGLISVSDKKVKGIDLQGSFTVIPDGVLSVPIHTSLPKKQRSLEVIAYQTYEALGTFKNGLYMGPLLSAGFLRETELPSAISSIIFPSYQSFVRLGAGVKVDYYIALSEKLFFTLGTNITVVDFGFFQGRIENPNLPLAQQKQSGLDFNLIRNQIPLMAGLAVRFGK